MAMLGPRGPGASTRQTADGAQPGRSSSRYTYDCPRRRRIHDAYNTYYTSRSTTHDDVYVFGTVGRPSASRGPISAPSHIVVAVELCPRWSAAATVWCDGATVEPRARVSGASRPSARRRPSAIAAASTLPRAEPPPIINNT